MRSVRFRRIVFLLVIILVAVSSTTLYLNNRFKLLDQNSETLPPPKDETLLKEPVTPPVSEPVVKPIIPTVNEPVITPILPPVQQPVQDPIIPPIIVGDPEGNRIPSSYEIANDPLFVNACFIGDSFTTGLKGYTNPPAAYFIDETGLTVAKAINRLSEISYAQPSRFFILLGINDMGYGYSPQEFTRQYQQLTTAIQERFPGATIYIQIIPPVTNLHSAQDSSHSNERIASYNQAITQFSREQQLFLLNPWNIFREADGSLRVADSYDGLHLEYSGNFVWLEQLKRLLETN